MDMKIGQTTLGELIPYFVILVILFLIIIFCIKAAIKTSKIKKAVKKEMKNKKKNGLRASVYGNHMAGLPMPEGLVCTIETYNDKYIFLANNSKFDLLKSKLTNVCIKTDTEISKQYVSSIGGALAGAVVFGPLGAIIGGMTKTKKDKTIHRYLIFTYLKNDATEYISFDVTNCMNAFKILDDFLNNVTPKQTSFTL